MAKELTDKHVQDCLKHISGAPGLPESFKGDYCGLLVDDWDKNPDFVKEKLLPNQVFSSVCAFVRRQLKLLKKQEDNPSYGMSKRIRSRKQRKVWVRWWWTYSGDLIENYHETFVVPFLLKQRNERERRRIQKEILRRREKKEASKKVSRNTRLFLVFGSLCLYAVVGVAYFLLKN